MEEEIVIACCSGSSSLGKSATESENSQNRSSLSAFRLTPKAETIVSFKDSDGVPNGILVVANPDGLYGRAGDYIACVQCNKPSIQFYSWSREQVHLRCAAPEKIGPVVVTSDGSYILAGGESGKAYCWEICSGDLIRVWKAHYRSITALRILDDDSYVISGGKDSLLHCWNLSDLLDEENHTLHASVTWTEHRLPVTSIKVGSGGVTSRIITSSLDKTVKIWSIPVESMICSIVFPCPLHDCVLDPVERWIYCGGDNGEIYVKPILNDAHNQEIYNRKRKRKEDFGQGQSGNNTLESENANIILGSHQGAILCLDLNANGTILVSGSADGSCQIWDTQSRQSIKSISFVGPVVALTISIAPSKQLHHRGSQGKQQNLSKLHALYKYKSVPRQKNGKEDPDGTGWINVRLVDRNEKEQKNEDETTIGNSFGNDLVLSSREGNGGIEKERLRSALSELEHENDRWKTINSKLYSMVVEHFPRGSNA